MRNALRSLMREPRAPDNPGILWWDRWLVFAIVAGAVVEGVLRDDVVWRPLAVVLAIGLALTLLWRRTHPLAVTTVTFGLITVMNVVAIIRSDSLFGLYMMAFILLIPYALVRWGSGREIVIGLAIAVAGFITGIAADYTTFGEAVAAFVFADTPVLIGAIVRYRSYARSRDRDRAVLREREQLARELHDTIAHHMSAIAIQAQAGLTLADRDPMAPIDALEVIEAEASKTLRDMRTMVGALRQGEEPEIAPIPGVADIAALKEGVGQQPRLSVDLSGDLDAISPAVDAAIYRLAQESITNAMRHARHASSVTVSVKGDGRFVQITVEDDGDPMPAGHKIEAGFGLIGMGERAKLLGGDFEAGPVPGRGWAVTAVLPKNGSSR